MPNSALLTRAPQPSLHRSHSAEPRLSKVSKQLQSACPALTRRPGYSLLAPWGQLDIFSAPDACPSRLQADTWEHSLARIASRYDRHIARNFITASQRYFARACSAR